MRCLFQSVFPCSPPANYNNCHMSVKCGMSLPAELAKFVFIPAPHIQIRPDETQNTNKKQMTRMQGVSPPPHFSYEQSRTLSVIKSSQRGFADIAPRENSWGFF